MQFFGPSYLLARLTLPESDISHIMYGDARIKPAHGERGVNVAGLSGKKYAGKMAELDDSLRRG
jgi:hypothetical protein